MMLTVPALLAILGGVLTGLFIGAIPGLSVTMGVACILPFTFVMPPHIGIPYLLGIYKGGVFGGSIPAILIGVPGAGGSIATMLDGYPLSQQGRARSAIQMALYASFIGDFLSDLFTIFLAERASRLALLVGRPEFLSILIFSIVLISSVTAGKDKVKGFMASSFGLILAMIGVDVGGRWRLAFGIPYLAGGISFIPLVIGLFAFSTIIQRIIEGKKGTEKEKEQIKKMSKISKKDSLKWFEFLKSLPHILRSAGIGTFIGLIPAIGQPIAAFVGYSVAHKFSREKEKFGKGSLEGIAGAESGNNAVNGPSLIPLFTFGIPGDTGTALLLGAFMVHGLRPGPDLFTKHGEIMYAILAGMLLACIALLVLGHFLSKYFAKIASIPRTYLMPAVFSITVVGAYAVHNSFFDVGVMIVIGFLGFLMKRYGFPLAPVAITFLLGRMVEESLTQSMILFRGNILTIITRPLAAFFLLLAAMIIFMPSLSAIYYARKQKNT